MSIIIFSREIHSGKTTEIEQFIQSRDNAVGILMPDIDGFRNILNILSQEKRIIQLEKSNENSIQIGKYIFDIAAFDWANTCIIQEAKSTPKWLIIDEVGKLELNGNGLHDSVVKAIEIYDIADKSKQLLLVIRDTLFNEVIKHYNLKHFEVKTDLV
ncbi:MAG: nucleoside-triphosphatase [Bacteroidia bacterium]